MRRLALVLLPLIALAGLVAVFAMSLDRDPNLLRSVLIDKPAPAIELPPVDGIDRPGLTADQLRGAVTVVNVFASWCVPCRAEHPMLEVLKSRADIRLVGINQKDAPENAASQHVLRKCGLSHERNFQRDDETLSLFRIHRT